MKDKDTKSGLGEFWDQWIEEDEQEQQKIKELIKKRKQEASYENRRQSNAIQEDL